MRVLLDANVWISGLLSPDSHSGNLLAAAGQARIDLLVPAGLVRELREVMARPRISKRLPPEVGTDLLARLREIQVPPSPSRVSFDADPHDEYLLDAALEYKALLVTGDRALLDAEVPVHVLSPKEACQLLSL